MSDIFREVDEALQREKAEKFWKEYGPTLLGAALVMVLATAATTGYLRWSEHQNQTQTARLLSSLDQPDMAASLAEIAKDTDAGHAMIALMNAAGKKAAEKNFKEAASLYEQAAQNGSSPNLRDLAVILHVQSVLQADLKADKKLLLEKLKPVARRPDSAFTLQARLDSALLYGDELKDYTAALEMLTGFDAPDVPASLLEKANALRHVYTFEASANAP